VMLAILGWTADAPHRKRAELSVHQAHTMMGNVT